MSVRTDDRGSGSSGIVMSLAALVGTSVIAGLLAAGLVMPAVGAVGASARTGVDFFEALPAELEQTPLAQRSRILAADGSTIAVFYRQNRTVVPLKRIAPIMRKAQIAIEDARFYEHGGVDAKGVLRAAVNNASGSSTQGASTLTQQYVKLTLLENANYVDDKDAARAATEQTIARKLQEMKYAVALEQKISKDKILENYLNIAYYGDGQYGIETAAQRYFSVPAAKLTLAQAATLAGVVQEPGRTDPRNNPRAALTRRNVVLSRMLVTKAITKAEYDKAVKAKLGLKVKPSGNGCDTSGYAFFCNYVYQLVLKDKAFGETPQERRQLVFRGGLTIQTTLNPAVQRKAQKAVEMKVAARNRSNVAAAISVVEPGTGKILAMAQSNPYGRKTKKGQTVVNYNVDNAFGGGSGFQPGSTFKAFTLAAALEQGKSLNATISAPAGGSTFSRNEFNSSACWPAGNLADDFAPFNSEGKTAVGTVSIAKATADSINTAFVRLGADVGVCNVKAMAERLGIHKAEPETTDNGGEASDQIRPRPAMLLGSEETAPLTLAGAYAAFAADGVFCRPVAITAVKTVDGKAVKVPDAGCKQAMDQKVARGVTRALEGVLRSGTAARVQKFGRPAAGKTGTTNESVNTWFIGYTPQLSTAVWFGHPNISKPLKGIDTGRGYYGSQMYGATLAGPLWASFMSAASQGMPVKRFGQADDKTVFGDRPRVPDVTGMSMQDAQALLGSAGFAVQLGIPVASNVPVGHVVQQSPAAGAQVAAGAAVTLVPSIGAAVQLPGRPRPSTSRNPRPQPRSR
ncbi:MAG: penicillin-binding protein [Angustibacter sp.]